MQTQKALWVMLAMCSSVGLWAQTAPPSILSLDPSMPLASPAQTFTFRALAADATDPIDTMSMLVSNGSSATSNACYVQYSNTNQRFYLLNDAGDGWLPFTPGTNGLYAASNSQCAIQIPGAASSTGLAISAQVNVSVASGFQGPKYVFVNAASVSGMVSVINMSEAG